MRSLMFEGIAAAPVTVEAAELDTGKGIDIVGLPDAAVRESRQRVLRAVRRLGVGWTDNRVLFNLAPATRRKEGCAFDLPMAVAYAATVSGLALPRAHRYLVAGEIDLDGRATGMTGALAAAILTRELGLDGLILPAACAEEALCVEGVPVHGVEDVGQALMILRGERREPPRRGASPRPPARSPGDDAFGAVRGQEWAKRGLLVAAAGGHNVLMIGPPGSGKTMLARALPEILPPLGLEEALEVACVHAAAGLSRRRGFYAPPFRAPHHTVSRQALIGGGASPRPGEVTLAHRGVLFLDELPEFGREVLEVLRQPLEDREVTISRTREVRRFPAAFSLVGAMNPCPCGWHGEGAGRCRCTPRAVDVYRGRISGPLLDRIDLHLPVRRVPLEDMVRGRVGMDAAEALATVERARARQAARGTLNGRLQGEALSAAVRLAPAVERRLLDAVRGLGLSGRAWVRVLRLARTLADLAGRDGVEEEDLMEALQFRGLDREGGA